MCNSTEKTISFKFYEIGNRQNDYFGSIEVPFSQTKQYLTLIEYYGFVYSGKHYFHVSSSLGIDGWNIFMTEEDC